MDELSTRNLNIRANTDPAVVGSVKFDVNQIDKFSVENSPPYAILGDKQGDFRGEPFEPGEYEIVATVFSGPNATQTQQGSGSLRITLTGNAVEPTPTPTPTPKPGPAFKLVSSVDFRGRGNNAELAAASGLSDGAAVLDDRGGLWSGSLEFGDASAWIGQGGLCLTAAEKGNNAALWSSPEGFIELVDNSLYRVRLTMETDQTSPHAIPLWMAGWTNFSSTTMLGNTFGGMLWVQDAAGGANGIGRPQGRDTYDIYVVPPAAQTPQWRGNLNDGTKGAFDPEYDAINDIRFLVRIFDIGDAPLMADRDFGTICVNSITVERVGLDELEVEEVVYDAPINSNNYRMETISSNLSDVAMDDAAGTVEFALDTTFDRARLLPDLGGGDNRSLHPILWESDTLYRIKADIAATEDATETDPPDLISLTMAAATFELVSSNWTTRGHGGNMDLAGSPRKKSTAGGAQPYVHYFYSHNATASLEPDANRLRPIVDAFNTVDLFGPRTGADGLEISGLEVAKIRIPESN